jgi:hypothetical protein
MYKIFFCLPAIVLWSSQLCHSLILLVHWATLFNRSTNKILLELTTLKSCQLYHIKNAKVSFMKFAQKLLAF